MLSTKEIAQALLQEGFHCPAQLGSKVRRFEHVYMKQPLFLKQGVGGRDTTPVVLHPDYEAAKDGLLSVGGIRRSDGYYHNSNLIGFPKRMNSGLREIAYGIGIGFTDRAALTVFLDKMLVPPAPEPLTQHSLYDPACGSGGFLVSALEMLGAESARSMLSLNESIRHANHELKASHVRDDVAVTETERRALLKVRIGQGNYRLQLLSIWGGCAVTGVSNLEMLRASHAKPWHVSSPSERLDPFNGLLLVPNLDQAFDHGLISFDDSGSVVISPSLNSQTATSLGITASLRLRQVPAPLIPYLAWHRHNVFRP